jgi:nicotinic acid phosphoribosyltransferase
MATPEAPPLHPALLTDRYELTMIAAALADGTADRDCVFEVFARRLPHGRRYGVLAGTGRLLEALPEFCFGEAELDAVRAQGVTDQRLLDHLAEFRFTGDIDGYAEGDFYFPGSPVLTVRGSFGEAVLLETLGLELHRLDPLPQGGGGARVDSRIRFTQIAPHAAKRDHRMRAPTGDRGVRRGKFGVRDGASRRCEPQAEQHHVDVESVRVLQRDARGRHALATVERERETPEF